jgi:predicted DNA binding CopG/RHH family protein
MTNPKKRLERNKYEKYEKDVDLWENETLGASASHAVRVSDKQAKALDDALGLQLLSFRIQKSLIQRLKTIAKHEGIGYQPLMRQALTYYVREKEAYYEGIKQKAKRK